MAIDVRKQWNGESLHRGASAWTGVIEFDVFGAASSSEAVDALAASPWFLAVGLNPPATHPDSDLVYLESLDPQPAGFHRWIVRAQYSSTPRGFHPNPNNPLNDPAIYKWQIGNESEPIDRDAYGNPILNRAFDAFSQSANDESATLFFIVVRNEPFFNPAIPLGYMNRTNSVGMTILGTWTVAPGQVICKSIQPLTEASILSPYTPVEYVFQLKAPYASTIDADGLWDSFKLRILNQGIRGYWSNSGTITMGNICTLDGVAVSSDVRLDSTGKPMDSTLRILGTTSVGGPPSPQTPVSAPGTFPAFVGVDPMPPAPAVANAYLLKYTRKLPVNFADLHL